jgi:hypothetical protein
MGYESLRGGAHKETLNGALYRPIMTSNRRFCPKECSGATKHGSPMRIAAITDVSCVSGVMIRGAM